jgi:hypothetical protein
MSMLAIITLLVVVTISLLMVRVATAALTLTGISRPLARFQARSAFTGVGFTTTESEKIVNHPVRRRIIMALMLLGNAGIVTTIATLIGGFAATSPQGLGLWMRIALLAAGLGALWTISYSTWLDRQISRLTAHALRRWTDLDVRDYANLLHVSGGWGVSEMFVNEGDWIAGRELRELGLAREGVLVLGVQRAGGDYTGAPRGRTKINPGDTLVLYGEAERLANLDRRRAGIGGNLDHTDAVAIQQHEERLEQDQDRAATPNPQDSAG